MRFHFVNLPHTVASKEFMACAYSQKHVKICAMMRSLGHEVFEYSAEGSEAECTEHIDIISAEEQASFFGGHDWKKLGFNLKWDTNQPYWKLSNRRAADEIKKRLQREDFICLIGGVCQKPIADAVGEADAIVVEYGVGYYGVFSRFRVFESYTHQACVYGMLSGDPNGSLYDAVIPNYYDPEDFPAGDGSGDYLLFLSRLIYRKGLQIALDTARASGLKLILAGQGVQSLDPDAGLLTTEEGDRIELEPGKIEYAGYADVAKRAELMRNARALMLPTIFMEPFGGAAVESQLAGTPAITTDYAAFSETVVHGVTGFRCHTLAQFVEAAKQVGQLDRAAIRERALALYSMDVVKYQYDAYFRLLLGLWREGWPELEDSKGAFKDLSYLPAKVNK